MYQQKPEISIILPVKNERKNLAWTVDKIRKVVRPKFELIIVYDDEKDNTLPVARKLVSRHRNIRLVRNDFGKGVVNATLKGFNTARGEILVMMAADRTDDPKTLNSMYEKIEQGYDIVCPTRYSKGGRIVSKVTLKSVLSRLSGITTPYLLGIPTSDLTYSYKMFKKEILKSIKIESRGGFEFAEELLIKGYFAGFKVTEVPTFWVDRKYGKSKFKLMKWLPKYIYWYLFGVSQRFKRSI